MTDRTHDDARTRAALAGWVARLAAEFDLDPRTIDTDAVLGLAGDVAHRVVRPAAPLTTYLVGLRVGRAIERGDDPASAFRDAVDAIDAAHRTAENATPEA